MENGGGADRGSEEEDVSFICERLGIDAYRSLGLYFTIPSRYSGQARPQLDRTARHRYRLSNGEGRAQPC